MLTGWNCAVWPNTSRRHIFRGLTAGALVILPTQETPPHLRLAHLSEPIIHRGKQHYQKSWRYID